MARSMGQRVTAIVLAAVFLFTSVFIGLLVVWQAMSEDSSTTNQAAEQSSAGQQMEDFTPVESVDELQITDIVEGEGREAQAGDLITVGYTGAVAATGIIFESSFDNGEPVTFPLSGLIEGWQEGIPGMKEGGQRRLLIPAELAYGDSPPPGSSIQPGAALVFDITLYSVEDMDQDEQ